MTSLHHPFHISFALRIYLNLSWLFAWRGDPQIAFLRDLNHSKFCLNWLLLISMDFTQRVCARSVAQSCLTLCDPMDYSPPGSSAHGILQARILEWAAISTPGDVPNPGIKTCIFLVGRQILYHWATWEAPYSKDMTEWRGVLEDFFSHYVLTISISPSPLRMNQPLALLAGVLAGHFLFCLLIQCHEALKVSRSVSPLSTMDPLLCSREYL